MSDTQQGPEWWLASDGKWYPPEAAPPSDPAQDQGPSESPKPGATPWYAQWWVLVVGALILFGGGLGVGVLLASDDDPESVEATGTATEAPEAEPTETPIAEQTEEPVQTATEEPTEPAYEEPTPSEEPTEAANPDVTRASTLASPYLQGTLDLESFPGEADEGAIEDEVTVIAVGTPENSTPVVVRNNTSGVVEVDLTATARNADGDLVGSGEDQGLEPVQVEPGHIAIGYVYLGFDDPPPGTTLAVEARGSTPNTDFGGLPAVIVEHNLTSGQFSEQVVGIVRNDNDVRMEGPISILVMCFDDEGNPLSHASGFLDTDALDPDQEGSFAVDLYGDDGCPKYLVGASGWTY